MTDGGSLRVRGGTSCSLKCRVAFVGAVRPASRCVAAGIVAFLPQHLCPNGSACKAGLCLEVLIWHVVETHWASSERPRFTRYHPAAPAAYSPRWLP
eukprot:scaffold113942_cov72-Phaeocystis_antarctica.AAC.2